MAEHLLKLDRIGVTKLEEETDHVVAGRDIGIVGNNRHTRAARISPGPDHFHDVALCRHERVAIHEQVHLDDLDGLVARDRHTDEDVDLPLNEIVHDQLFASELFIEMEHIGDVTVWILQRHHAVLHHWSVRGWGRGKPFSRRRRCLGVVWGRRHGGRLGLGETGINRCERQRRNAEKP